MGGAVYFSQLILQLHASLASTIAVLVHCNAKESREAQSCLVALSHLVVSMHI